MIKIYKKEGYFHMSDGKSDLYDPVLLIERLAGKVYIEIASSFENMPPLVSDLAEEERNKLADNLYQILKSKAELLSDEAGLRMLDDMDSFLTKSLFGQDMLDKVNERRVSRIVDVLSSHAPC
jgi:hypothetical protein